MTAVYVTHDQAEAMALANRVAVMDRGRVVQYAPPIELYRRPATTFVADFVGNPPMNLIPVAVHQQDGQLLARADGLSLAPLPITDPLGKAVARGSNLTLGIRPEHLAIGDRQATNWIEGRLFANENMGPESLVTLLLTDERRITARLFTDDHLALDGDVTFTFSPGDLALFDGEGNRIPAGDE